MNKKPTSSDGLSAAFTLLELLVVIAIIMLLSGILFPAFSYARNQAKIVKAKSDVKQLEFAWKAVLSDYRTWLTAEVTTGNDQEMIQANVDYLQKGNPKHVLYMEFPAGTTNFTDPWKINNYHFALGTDSITPKNHEKLFRDVGAWSYGKNKSATDIKNHVTSWK